LIPEGFVPVNKKKDENPIYTNGVNHFEENEELEEDE
jgi:hypothetical protein